MGNASSDLLFTAITDNQIATVKTLLSSGKVSANAKDFFECPALLHACGATDGRVRLGCVEALLQSGADPHTPHPTTGYSAIHYASRMGDPRLLRLLLVLQRDQTKLTEDPSLPTQLRLPPPPIDLGIRTNDARGDTPLHLAAARSIPSIPILRLLVYHGADPEARNRLGQTPSIPQALLTHIQSMEHDPADDLVPLDPRDTAAVYNPEDTFDPENDPDLQIFFPSLPLQRKVEPEISSDAKAHSIDVESIQADQKNRDGVDIGNEEGEDGGDKNVGESHENTDYAGDVVGGDAAVEIRKNSREDFGGDEDIKLNPTPIPSSDVKERLMTGSHVHVAMVPDQEFDSDLDQFIKDAFMISPKPAQPVLENTPVHREEIETSKETGFSDPKHVIVDQKTTANFGKDADEVDIFEKEIEEFEREMEQLRSKGYSVGQVVPVIPLDLSESPNHILLGTSMSRHGDPSDPVSNLVISALPPSWQNSPLIQRNLRFFQANYLVGVSVLLFFCLIINPWLILGLLFLSALWLWVIVNQRRRVVMGTERAQETAANVFLIAVTALVLVFFASDPIIFWLMMGVFSLVAIHALIYVPTDR